MNVHRRQEEQLGEHRRNESTKDCQRHREKQFLACDTAEGDNRDEAKRGQNTCGQNRPDPRTRVNQYSMTSLIETRGSSVLDTRFSRV